MAKTYIQSPMHWKEMYSRPEFNGRWTPVDEVSICDIKIDRSLFSFQNEVDYDQVRFMLNNFATELWVPIRVNKNYFLLDGKYRLQTARDMGLLAIDVIVQDDDIV